MARRIGALVALLMMFIGLPSPASAATCYVKSGAPGGDGTSWANAYADLQSALTNYPTCLEIHVARGTYKPTSSSDRAISFNIKPGVLVYGGFAGTESSLGERNLTFNTTILSGDIGVAGDASDNSYHVVVMDGTTSPITTGNVLSDFTIRDGNASGSINNQGNGGGFLCDGSGAGHECSPELDDLVFENNSAGNGGGICDSGVNGGTSSPDLHAVVFRNNTATNIGGGMFNDGRSGTSSPLVEQSAFIGNTAGFSAGAIYNDGSSGVSSPTVRNTTFYANTGNFGGAMVNDGTSGGHANPQLRYLTFTQNRTQFGAGAAVRNLGSGGESNPSLSGVIFWADIAVTSPIEMDNTGTAAPTLEYSITSECPGGAVGCVNADPLLDPLRYYGGFAPSLRPQVGSPAIEAGNATNCPGNDQRGIARPQGAKCDIGAVELLAAEKRRCYVNPFALPPSDGQTWGSAYPYLFQGLADPNCTEVWVAGGVYYPSVASTDRTYDLVIPPGKAVYGGFAGGETLRTQRDPSAHQTILSGDIGVPGDDSDNSYHVVALDAYGAATNITDATVLDGFTIEHGNANGDPNALQHLGGGLICNGPSGFACSPTLANLVFTGNSAVGGGAVANYGGGGGMSSPRLQSVTFTANHATDSGGAIINSAINGTSSPVITDAVFSGNTAAVRGGAMMSTAPSNGTSVASVTASMFENNSSADGGAVYALSASPTFEDDVFSGNVATGKGGAAYSDDASVATNLSFTGVTFIGNNASTGGGAVYGNMATHATSTQLFDHVTMVGNDSPNSVGAAIGASNGNTLVRDSLFSRNGTSSYGGALGVIKGAGSVDRSAFVSNTAVHGGAVYVRGANVAITNSTFWKNLAGDGGAVEVVPNAGGPNGILDLQNVTMANNTAVSGPGGAVRIGNGTSDGSTATATIGNSIFWGDSASTTDAEINITSPDGTGSVAHSIVQTGCPTAAVCDTVTSSYPGLGPFQYNGGDTPTMMPVAGGPAIDTAGSCLAEDQRGVARPQGAACDIGAVERRATEDNIFNNGFEF